MHAPSNTARHVALLRAAHQICENGSVFKDPYAFDIIGESPESVSQTEQASPMRRAERLFVSARSRFAEDRASTALEEGAGQIVVLGAGFDTYSLRVEPGAGQRHFEIDHPETQRKKRAAIEEAGLRLRADTRLVPVDFEKDELFLQLQEAGFDKNIPTFFFWLGVVPYLKEETVFDMLSSLCDLPWAEIVFDYGQSPEDYSGLRRERYEAMIAEAHAMGEPWLSFFQPDDLNRKLRAIGYTELEDLGVSEIGTLYVPSWRLPKGTPGGHIMRARYRRH